ncbi:uncharacterized protein LOC111338168 [Stylophora pistillata]|uniref:uncharacterized protein LOC111338168 n=1 Tax=Stylophora pistillata TaxID=50429 RepID=UPI000C04390F|nr:uncharacterized protein LOC111338168 [Stylophora pistillata]
MVIPKDITKEGILRDITAEAILRDIATEVIVRDTNTGVVPQDISTELVPRDINTEVIRRDISRALTPQEVDTEVIHRITTKGVVDTEVILGDITTEVILGSLNLEGILQDIIAEVIRVEITMEVTLQYNIMKEMAIGKCMIMKCRLRPRSRFRSNARYKVTAIIEAELTCLDAQMTFAPPEVTRAARMKLLEKTLKWAAAREEAKIKPSSVDAYTKNVVQVLIKPDSVKFPERERDPRSASLDEPTVNELMFGFAQAQYKGDLQDKEFEAHPNKKAAMRKIREGEDLHSGAARLLNLNLEDGEFYHVLHASLEHLDFCAKEDLC